MVLESLRHVSYGLAKRHGARTILVWRLREVIPAVHDIPSHGRISRVTDYSFWRDTEEDISVFVVGAPLVFPSPILDHKTAPSWPALTFVQAAVVNMSEDWRGYEAQDLCFEDRGDHVRNPSEFCATNVAEEPDSLVQ